MAKGERGLDSQILVPATSMLALGRNRIRLSIEDKYILLVQTE
jgi:hypothetical protein